MLDASASVVGTFRLVEEFDRRTVGAGFRSFADYPCGADAVVWRGGKSAGGSASDAGGAVPCCCSLAAPASCETSAPMSASWEAHHKRPSPVCSAGWHGRASHNGRRPSPSAAPVEADLLFARLCTRVLRFCFSSVICFFRKDSASLRRSCASDADATTRTPGPQSNLVRTLLIRTYCTNKPLRCTVLPHSALYNSVHSFTASRGA